MSAKGEIETRRSLDGLRMYLLRQRWDQPNIEDIDEAVQRELAKTPAWQRIRTGDEIAITAGSRGIASLPHILRAVAAAVRRRGGRPFIFPAMGSHGGGTAEGQRELLAGLGVDEETMGVPIRSSMEVVRLGETEEGLPVYVDAYAAAADGIILVNRVKKHTNFDAPIESGLAKMAVIGLGKHAQAEAVHQYGNYGLREYIPKVARVVFERARVLAGLAIIENAFGGVAELVGLAPQEILDREPALLARAKELSPKIPFHDIDIALVERMGKEISGTGMDCYIIGRRRIIGEPEWPEAPQIRTLVVIDLTEASHGNGLGVGLADMTTRRLADKIDWAITRANIMTSGNLERGKLPLVFDTDRDALEAAAFRERATPLEALRVVCIRDTLHLRHLLVSEALAREAAQRDDLEIISEALPLPFDEAGNWQSPFQ
ncbi:MAG: DUF2088 domain-containing protein [Chloroflexi bacterium]|nr:DUF2088 domain-containing protein [Chloroflexota bacterium]